MIWVLSFEQVQSMQRSTLCPSTLCHGTHVAVGYMCNEEFRAGLKDSFINLLGFNGHKAAIEGTPKHFLGDPLKKVATVPLLVHIPPKTSQMYTALYCYQPVKNGETLDFIRLSF